MSSETYTTYAISDPCDKRLDDDGRRRRRDEARSVGSDVERRRIVANRRHCHHFRLLFGSRRQIDAHLDDWRAWRHKELLGGARFYTAIHRHLRKSTSQINIGANRTCTTHEMLCCNVFFCFGVKQRNSTAKRRRHTILVVQSHNQRIAELCLCVGEDARSKRLVEHDNVGVGVVVDVDRN
jgi:hypothetical protein